MKKFLFSTAFAIALFCSSSISNASVTIEAAQISAAKPLFEPVLRGSVQDWDGVYTVYVYAESDYYGNFSGVTLAIRNNLTGSFFTPSSKIGNLTSDSSGDYISHGKARFYEDGVLKEIFFDGNL